MKDSEKLAGYGIKVDSKPLTYAGTTGSDNTYVIGIKC